MGLMRAVAASALGYVAVLLALILMPVLFLACLWTGLCLLAALFMFLFWLLVTHQAHTLYSALYIAAWGFPPCLVAGVLNYYREQIRAAKSRPMLTLNQDAPFR